jgi:phosphatidylglycerophosphate synthase
MGFNNWYKNFKKDSINWRAKYFRSVLKLMAKLKITPNGITCFRLLFIFPLAYCFYLENLWGVLVFYLLFWLFDLLDGALARYLNIQSDKGRFLDSVVDNFMYAFLILGFIYLESAIVWLLAYNILIEITAQVLATIKKRAGQPSDWLIKVTPDIPYFKSLAHLLLILYLFNLDILNIGFVFLNIWLTVTVFYYFKSIKKK